MPVTDEHVDGKNAADHVRQAFAVALDLPADADVEGLVLGESTEWDSIGHMTLVAELEERFGVSLETDDIIAMSSYAESLEILRRLGVGV
jgi:acyl carrier protein